MNSTLIDLSVVAPAYNEEEGIKDYVDNLRRVLESLNNLNYEIIVVNDGSNDKTLEVLLDNQWNQLKVLDLISNVGHMNALSAGLAHANGNIVITMDADLQHPVDHIPLILNEFSDSNVDVVQCIRKRDNSEGVTRRIFSEIYYRIMNKMSDSEININAGEFRGMRKEVVTQLLTLKENPRFLRFLIPYFGYRTKYIEFAAQQRKKGKSKYSFKQLLKFVATSIISFSSTPINFMLKFGIFAILLTLVYLIALLFDFQKGNFPPGYFSIIIMVASFGSLQLISIGIIGKYVSQILFESRYRPRFLVRKFYEVD